MRGSCPLLLPAEPLTYHRPRNRQQRFCKFRATTCNYTNVLLSQHPNLLNEACCVVVCCEAVQHGLLAS